ncbi:hypothetical protein FQN54_009743 [Arachnomyces sp. PD_36]|nr:hypothetical protein FQN54_009743 [Arachnomyces sp. PD_36]
MGGKINAYFDCVSPYAFFAFLHLRKNRALLASYGIDIEMFPIFLGGVNVATGNNFFQYLSQSYVFSFSRRNKPPFTVPAKAKYGTFDRVRSAKYFGVRDFTVPEFFPILSLLPQRCMTYVKEKYSKDRFEDAFLVLWEYIFFQHLDISKPENMIRALADGKFAEPEIREIMAAAGGQEFKQKLLDRTQEAVDRGAYGAPWFWVRNEKGEEEPFFGSDRFHYMWEFLGIPWSDIQIGAKPSL